MRPPRTAVFARLWAPWLARWTARAASGVSWRSERGGTGFPHLPRSVDDVIAVDAIEAAGLDVSSVERFTFPDTPVSMPTSPHVLGEAVAA